MSIRLVPDGDNVIVQILSPNTGEVLTASRLTDSVSGAVGGQLLSAAHAPLQSPYDAEGAVVPAEAAQEAPVAVPAPPAPTVTPIDVAARSRTILSPAEEPSTLVYDSSNPATAAEWEAAWEFTHRAQEQMVQLGITRDQVLAAAEDPEYTTAPAYGTGTNHVRDGIRALIASDNPKVIIGISRTPSDHRSYPNCIAEIRRQTGIDITQQAGVRR